MPYVPYDVLLSGPVKHLRSRSGRFLASIEHHAIWDFRNIYFFSEADFKRITESWVAVNLDTSRLTIDFTKPPVLFKGSTSWLI